MADDLKALQAHAEAHGWRVEVGGRHLKWRGPKGQLVVSAITPSDHRALMNIKSDLRKRGLPLPEHPHKRKKKS